MTKRFKNAMKALIGAFFEGTLAKGTCRACAVSNIVANSYGIKARLDRSVVCEGIDVSEWNSLFITMEKTDGTSVQEIRNGDKDSIYLALKLIEKSGYSEKELALIEFIFENNAILRFEDYPKYTKNKLMEDQYKGLCSVVDVLCQLEGYDSQEYKKMFEYTPEFQQVNQLV